MNVKRLIIVFALTAVVLGTVFSQNPNTAFEQRTVELINIEREKQGLAPYIWHDTLVSIARANCSGNINISQMLRDNIATSTGHHMLSYTGGHTPEQRVAAWMDSNNSRATILRENRTHIGIGVLPADSSTRHSWTLIVINMIDLTPSGIREFEMRVFELTNIERAKHGLAPLIWHDVLADAARAHSLDLMVNNMRGHTGSDGSSVRQRIERAGITNTNYRAENCCYGQSTPEEAVESWMNSPGHRANILNASVTHLGVGLALRTEGASAQYASYWTQKFAAFR